MKCVLCFMRGIKGFTGPSTGREHSFQRGSWILSSQNENPVPTSHIHKQYFPIYVHLLGGSPIRSLHYITSCKFLLTNL